MIAKTDSKLYSLDLGFDYSDIKTLFSEFKGKILSTLTSDVVNLVKEQGINLLK